MNMQDRIAALYASSGSLVGRVFEFHFDSAGKLQMGRELPSTADKRFKFLSRVYLTNRLPIKKSPCAQLLRKELGA